VIIDVNTTNLIFNAVFCFIFISTFVVCYKTMKFTKQTMLMFKHDKRDSRLQTTVLDRVVKELKKKEDNTEKSKKELREEVKEEIKEKIKEAVE